MFLTAKCVIENRVGTEDAVAGVALTSLQAAFRGVVKGEQRAVPEFASAVRPEACCTAIENRGVLS